MSYWFNVMIFIETLIITSLSVGLVSLNSQFGAILFLAMLILGFGIIRIGYIDYKDARKKKEIKSVRDSTIGLIIAIVFIFVLVNIAMILSLPLAKLILRFIKIIDETTLRFWISLILMFPLIKIFDVIKSIIILFRNKQLSTKDKLTILYMRPGFGKFKKKVSYRFKNYNKPIYLFSSKEREGAHCTPFNTIIMQDIFFENYSKNVRDYIFLHEYGHTKLNFLLRLIFYILAIPTLYFFFMIIPFILFAPILFLIIGFPQWFAVVAFFTYLFTFLGISLVILILSWSIETHAELFAIKNIGEKNYLSALQEVKKDSKKRNIFKKYFYHIRYPPQKLLLWWFRKREIKGKDG